MLQRDLIDELYEIALRRYKKERPNFKITNEFAAKLWFSIKGILDHEGEVAARDYVENALLHKSNVHRKFYYIGYASVIFFTETHQSIAAP